MSGAGGIGVAAKSINVSEAYQCGENNENQSNGSGGNVSWNRHERRKQHGGNGMAMAMWRRK
jgi:hypothetical protein